MKNQEILLKKGIKFDPFKSFPFINDEQKCSSLIEKYKDISPLALIDILKKTKGASHILSQDEETQRDEITYVLFKRMEQFADIETVVLIEKLYEKDQETLKQLEWNQKNKPVTPGSHSFILKSLPSRYQRDFFRLSILTGFSINVSSLRDLGCQLEEEAFSLLKNVA